MSGNTCDVVAIHPDRIKKAREKAAAGPELARVSELYKIFGDLTRIKILNALDAVELCVCDLAHLLDMTNSAISHQLAVLKKYNLVKARKEGKIVYYSLSDSHVKTIIGTGLEHIREDKNEKPNT